MKKYIIILFAFIGSFAYTQELDFQQLCLDCAEANGFYCGDDPANWTQYSPNGCVQTSWLNDGWEDCVDASDENEAAPTVATDCAPPPPPPCDTVYVDVIQYETIFDTVPEYIYEIIIDTVEVEVFVPEYIYITDTVTIYEDILDTLFVNVIEYVDVFVYDTIVEIEYVEFIEYVDCETGMPCSSNIQELIDKSKRNSVIYNINGQAIKEKEGLYIEDGKIKYKIN